MNHLIILPILWPLLVALLTMLPPFDRNLSLRRSLSVGGALVLVLLSVLLLVWLRLFLCLLVVIVQNQHQAM